MLRIAMRDDETEAREALYLLLDQELHEESEQIVYEFSTGTAAANWLQKASRRDRPSVSGCGNGRNERDSTAKKYPGTFDQNLLIVFVTGFADYVFDGYSVGAMDYLMKPVCKEKLQALLTRVREKLGQEEAEEFIVKNTDGTYRFLKERDPVVLQRQKESDACDRPGRIWILRQIRRSGKSSLRTEEKRGSLCGSISGIWCNTKWVDQIGSASGTDSAGKNCRSAALIRKRQSKSWRKRCLAECTDTAKR